MGGMALYRNMIRMTGGSRTLVAVVALLVALALVGCETKDKSAATSPSALSLLGTTTGTVLYSPDEAPPAAVNGPAGWEFELGNARYQSLDNGTPAIIVTMQLDTIPGPAMEVWLSNGEETVARWSGGIAHKYNGIICWQQSLAGSGEALAMVPGREYTLTVAFRDVASNDIVVSRKAPIRGTVPTLTGEPPQVGSEVFQRLLGCPRGS